MTFWTYFFMFFVIFSKMSKTMKSSCGCSQGSILRIQHLKNHIFFNDFPIIFYGFSWTPSWIDFFSLLWWVLRPKCDFGAMLELSWDSKPTKNRSEFQKININLGLLSQGNLPGTDLAPQSHPRRPQTPQRLTIYIILQSFIHFS